MEVKTKLDKNMQKELLANLFVMSIVFIILGAIGTLAYLIVDIILEIPDWNFLLLMIIPLGVGVAFYILYSRNIKSAKSLNKENVYTFNPEFVEIKTIYHGEIEGTSKLYYSDIYKIKETKNYFFIYLNAQQAYPVLKENVSDLDALKKLIYKK